MGSNDPSNAGRRRAKKDPSNEADLADSIDCNIVLVGLMGAGKSCIGRRLAQRLGLPFKDADQEIEEAAGCTIEEIFENHGEAYFRNGERRVIERLLCEKPQVIATGGGAYLDERTRAAIRENGVALWLRADLPLMVKRTARRENRPLLKQGNPKVILQKLIEERYPVYDKADLAVDSVDGPPEVTLQRTLDALESFFSEFPERLHGQRTDANASDESDYSEKQGDFAQQ
ncbi:MAG: shikimate kinase [Kiloniellales bacterium]|nr:shikimate kinase [Kiloniellales bacterium]